jgi:hypothetical protein
MTKVNLLPDWYLWQQREARRLRWRIALLLVLATCLTAWTLAERAHTESLARIAASLDGPLPVPRDLPELLEQKETQIRTYHDLRVAYGDVGHTVPMSALLQQVQNDMAPGMALSRATISVLSEPFKERSNAASGPPAPARFHEVAHFTVVGVAPNDLLIAQLIDRLQRNRLFDDLSLNYARSEILRNTNVRRFEIQMTIDLDRLSTRPGGAGGGGAAGPTSVVEGPHAD